MKIAFVITIILSSAYAVFLDHSAVSNRAMQRGLVVLIVTFLIVLYYLSKDKWKDIFATRTKWLFVFYGATFVQSLVLSTGGLRSPFLILIHLFMIGLSFLFNFYESLLFLILSFLVILLDLSFNHNLGTFFLEDPSLVVLQVVSLVSIIPMAYIVSRQYHIRELLSQALSTKIKTDEVIMRSLNELIIVTDPKYNILSINDAVLRATHKSRSEILGKPLFKTLLFRSSNGKLLNEQIVNDKAKKIKPGKIGGEFMLISSSLPKRSFIIHIQPLKNLAASVDQISFIFSRPDDQEYFLDNKINTIIENARSKYEALLQRIKATLSANKLTDVKKQIILLEKIEDDIYCSQTMLSGESTKTQIDIVQFCKHIIRLEVEFANIFNVALNFKIKNFGIKDVEHLTVKDYPVKPTELTGPFFSAKCDAEKFEIIIKKLIEVAILLGAENDQAGVEVGVERVGEDNLVIKILSKCPPVHENNLLDIFTPYYGKLADKTRLHLGSGLEGFLAKSLCEVLSISLETKYSQTPTPHVLFSLHISK